MQWMQVSIETVPEAVDAVCGCLYRRLGNIGLEIEDARDWQDFLENSRQYWDLVDEGLAREKETALTRVKLYISDDSEGHAMLRGMAEEMEQLRESHPPHPLGTLCIQTRFMNEQDWANAWKQYYKPLRVGKNLVIRPCWEEYTPRPDDRVITLDPGVAFGTGTHETTALCLSLLEDVLRGGERVLDIGSGSGILSVGALVLGAQCVTAVDIDPLAVKITMENGRLNGFSPPELCVLEGNLTDTVSGQYDVVIANIIADAICTLAQTVARHLRPGGLFVSSGIILDRAEDVVRALTAQGFLIERRETDGEWVAFAARQGGKADA